MAALLAVLPLRYFCILHPNSIWRIENYKQQLGVILRMPPFVFAVAHSEMIKDLENLKGI
jgi:hypothetical protein